MKYSEQQAAELAIQFAEWLVKRKVEPVGGGIWEDHGTGQLNFHPVRKTQELYNLFLQSKNKQP